ncbi:MAG: OmpA family protein [Gammaproteobacteria bacterium]
MRKHSILSALVALAATGGAHAMNHDGDFAQALARHYDALARAEQVQGDTRDARTYALRATAAAGGQPTAPDSLELRRPYLKDKYTAELDAARQRLVGALDGEARTRAADDAARAQAAFDCWAEQAQEDLQPEHIAACRGAFEMAMNAVDQRLAQVEAPPPPPPAAPPPPATPENYLVFFDFDRADITDEGRAVLQNVVDDAAGQTVSRVVATGHADTSGSARYNERLSQRRADAVRAALSDLQLETGGIVTEARGETEPLVPTGDGVREPQNRRVEIKVER